MIFQHTWQLVLSGQKTQTRRIQKPPYKHTLAGAEYKGETFVEAGYMWDGSINECEGKPFPGKGVYIIQGVQPGWVSASYYADADYWFTAKWIVGRDYAVQPGRGKKQIARIRITGIRQEDVRQISDADVKAEGFETRWQFFMTWIEMHDKSFMEKIRTQGSHVEEEITQRPDNRYQAWVLEFELAPKV